MKKIRLLIISVFIIIFSNFVSANDNQDIIELIASTEMTLPLILVLFVVIVFIVINLVKMNKSKDILNKYKKKEEKLIKNVNKKQKVSINNLKKKITKKPGKFQKELVGYIAKSSKLHVSDEKIKQNLLNAGWKQEDIERTFEEINKL